MNVGILTFHWANNYGAVLQAYALRRAIEKMDKDVQVIDFSVWENNRASKTMLILKAINRLFKLPLYLKLRERRKKILDFRREHLSLTDNTYSTEEKLSDCLSLFDAFICGSDQIWNPLINGFSKAYLLSFVPDDKRKISYAASFGLDSIPDAYSDVFEKYLKKFNYISVREKDGIKEVKKLAGKEATHVLDPVFLLSAEEWEKLATPPKEKEQYVLLYIMEENAELVKLAKSISKETGKKLISINIPRNRVKGANVNILNAGPQEFVGLIKNASYVCTNSFHGTAFSILFNKPFITVPHTSRNSRLVSLLDTMGITSQMMDKVNDAEMLQDKFKYDVDSVNEKLQNEINKSLGFLTQSLKVDNEKI